MGEAKKINEIEKNLENLKFELDRRFKKYLKSLKGIVKIDPIRRKENLEEYENGAEHFPFPRQESINS